MSWSALRWRHTSKKTRSGSTWLCRLASRTSSATRSRRRFASGSERLRCSRRRGITIGQGFSGIRDQGLGTREGLLVIGKSLAHIEILEKLSEGGMGEVYRGRDRKLGREVAVKALPEHFAQSADHLARFEREAHEPALCSVRTHRLRVRRDASG